MPRRPLKDLDALLGPRRVDGIGGHRKWQAAHHHAAERVADHVDAFPECVGAEQRNARATPKALEQPRA